MPPAEGRLYPVPKNFARPGTLCKKEYKRLYNQSVEQPEIFWREQAGRLDWGKDFTIVSDWSFDKEDLHIKWFEDGQLNVCVNCVDRHLAERGDEIAIIWEGDEPDQHLHISYKKLHEEVCRFANVLRGRGVKKGDRVTLYMPMVPEAAYAMLACARIGAVHSVVFGGFSPEALAGRIQDCKSDCVITADEGVRGGKIIPLKENLDKALAKCDPVHSVIVVQRTGADIFMDEARDVAYGPARAAAQPDCPAEMMNAEDPLFILYTSGSTGKPKGVLHTSAGYLLWASLSHELVFDYRPGDIYWCTADVGWVTGHSYIIYGPLANGATTVMFEGVPNYPDIDRFWQIVDKHQVNQFFTAPTAIRAIMGVGDEPVQRHSRASLRLLGTVGEPINPEVWEWYHRVVGDSRCPIMDTWWQTETGAAMITPARCNRFKTGFCNSTLFRCCTPAGGRGRKNSGRRSAGQSPYHPKLAGPDADRIW